MDTTRATGLHCKERVHIIPLQSVDMKKEDVYDMRDKSAVIKVNDMILFALRY